MASLGDLHSDLALLLGRGRASELNHENRHKPQVVRRPNLLGRQALRDYPAIKARLKMQDVYSFIVYREKIGACPCYVHSVL